MELDLLTLTAAELQDHLQNGRITSLELVRLYHGQILKYNESLRAIISVSPLSLIEKIAKRLDDERRDGHIRGSLHGIPIIIKDALNTTESFGLQSTNGGWAFEDCRPRETAQVVQQCVDAGMILLGKANLSEFANWKQTGMTAGWSARGGQTESAYVQGGVNNDDGPVFGHSNPCGSSTGSAVGVSAGFAPISIGADYNGSLTNPAIRAALYTMRVTPGLVPEDGGFPFAKDRDSLGPMAKSVEDMKNLLNVMIESAHPQAPKNGYQLDPGVSWKDISIATLDPQHWRIPEEMQKQYPGTFQQIVDETLAAYSTLGKIAKKVVGPVELIDAHKLSESASEAVELIVNDYSTLFDAYLGGLETPKIRNLAELIAFNDEHQDLEQPPDHPGQDRLVKSQEEAERLSDTEYAQIDAKVTAVGATDGVDRVLKEHDVDIIIGPADSRLPDVLALARYPAVTLPLSYLHWNGRPFGLLACSTKYQEQLLLNVAACWERTFPSRKAPELNATKSM